MKTYKIYLAVSKNFEYQSFLKFINLMELDIETVVSNTFSQKEAVLADMIFVDEITANHQYEALSGLKKEKQNFIPVLLLASEKTNRDKSFPACIDDIIFKPFSSAEWKRRLRTYLLAGENEKKIIDRDKADFKALFTESNSIIHDITEKVYAEQQLNESISNYRKFIENAPDIIILLDKMGTIKFVNQRIREYGNYAPDEIIGKSVTDFIPSQEHQKVREAMRRVFGNNQKSRLFSTTLLLKNGKSIPILTKGILLKHKGEMVNMTIIRDVTLLKEAEKKLKESKETFENIFNNSSVAIYIQDKNGTFLDINKAAVKQYGYNDKSELIGKTPEFVSAEGKNNMAEIKKHLKLAFAGKSQQFEFWAKSRNGHIFPKLVVVEKGIFFGETVVYNFSFDISERKKLEEMIHENEAKLNSIFNSSPNPAHLVNENFEIILANDKLLEIKGQKLKDIQGKKCYEVYQGKPEVCDNCEVRQVFETHKPASSENTLTLPNGEVRYFKTLAYPIFDIGGKIKYAMESTVDISEQKLVDEKLKQSEAKYHNLFHFMKNCVAVYRVSENGDVILKDMNRSAENLEKVKKEDVAGKKLEDVFPGVREFGIYRAIQQVFKTGKPINLPVTFYKDNQVSGWRENYLYKLPTGEVVAIYDDITRQKRAEEQLVESRNLFETLAKISPTGIFKTDAKGKTIYVNPQWTEITGISFEKSTSKGWANILPPNEREKLLARWTNNMAAKTFSKEKLRITRPDGTFRWVLGHAVPEINNGNFIGYVGTITDITDLVNAEQALNESETRLKKFSQITTEGIVIHNNGITVDANNAFLELTGYTLDEIKGKNIIELVVKPEYQKITYENVKKGYAVPYDIEAIKKDGTSLYVEISGVNYTSKTGETARAVVVRDNSWRRLMEKSLRESENKYRLLAETSSDLIFTFDITGKITYLSPVVKSMTGYSAREVLGKNFWDFIVPEHIEPTIEKFNRGIQGEDIPLYEIELTHKNGTRIPVELNVNSTYDADGNPTGRLVVARDITERKKAEKALRENEIKYRSLAEASIDMILTYDLEGRITYANPAVEEIFGYTPEEITGQQFGRYVSPDSLASAHTHFSKGIQGVHVPPYELELVHKNGKLVPVEINPTSLFDVEGKIRGRLTVVRDISFRKKAEEALRKSEKKYKEQSRLFRLMSDNIPDLVWAKDLEGRYIFTNKAYCEKLLIAKHPKETIGKTDMFFANRQRKLHPERKDWFTFGEICANSDIPVLEKKKAFRFDEYGYVRGKFLFLDVFKAPIFDENNQIIGTVGHGRDVTKEKEAEKELLLRDKALNAAANAIIITDADTVIEWVNQAFTSLTGYTKEEAVGRYTGDLIRSGKQDEAIFENMNKTLQSGQVWKGELTDKRKDGTLYEIEEIITPVTNAKGKVKHLIGIMADISERKAAERELKAAKEAAEESSRLKSAFLANMNHEIRTPMNAIMGFSELMLEATPEEKENYAKIVNTSAGQLLNLIDDVIFMSRLQSEKLPVKKITFFPADVIKEVFLMFNLPEMKKDLKLQIYLPEDAENIAIHADANKVKQVLTNFSSNAIKYTEKGFVRLGFEIRGASILFFVEDSGMGIPEKEHEHVFEAFYRGRMAVNSAIRGTGLGLNIAKELVELLGGTIGVSSQPRKGSRFYFSLPYEPVKIVPAQSASDKAKPKKWEDMYILIAEDDETNYFYLEVLLKNKVKKIDWAHNGFEAVELARQNKYDLVLMDMKMPLLSGDEATRKIKSLYPNLPVVATTAYATQEEKEYAMAVGCDDYLSKPIKKEDLIALVDKYVSGKY